MGFLTKKKTITDITFVELFTPDAAFRQAKFDTFYTTNSMGEYNEKMFYWKKDYRGRYKERYLERAGLEPQTDATILKIDNNLLIDYIKLVDPTVNEIISKRFRIPSIEYSSRWYLQNNYPGWSNLSEEVDIGGITYKLEDVDYADPDDDTILKLVLVDISDETNIVEEEFTNEFHAQQCINVRYETNASATEWFVYIETKDTIPLDIYTEDDLTMTAIIPLKENDEMHEDDLWVKRMLNKLGVGGNELTDQLVEETDIDNAYIFTGLRFNSENEYMAKALYKTFEHIYNASVPEPEDFPGFDTPVSDKVNFAMSEMNLAYDFDMTIEAIDGVATRKYSELDEFGEVVYLEEPLKVGSYTSVLNEDRPEIIDELDDAFFFGGVFDSGLEPGTGEQSTLKIRYQVSPNTYMEMVISNYVNTYTISGYDFTVYLDSDPEDGRLILPLDVMNKLKFKEWIAVHDRSFTLLAYSHQVVKIYWYQQDWFSWAVRIGLAWITGGASLTWDWVLDLAITYAISLVIGEILTMIDSEILMFVAAIALTSLGSAFAGNFDLADLTVENYLPMATNGIKQASGIYMQQMQAEIAKLSEKTPEEERRDELMEREANQGINTTKAITSAHMSHSNANSPEAWIAQQLGLGLYDYDQYYSVTGQIDFRKNVVSG